MTGGDLGSIVDVSPCRLFFLVVAEAVCARCVHTLADRVMILNFWGLLQSFRGHGNPLAAKQIPEPVVARIVYECLSLLATAHNRGYVHLDVKPVCMSCIFLLYSWLVPSFWLTTFKMCLLDCSAWLRMAGPCQGFTF
jgi:hypothetical protein